MESVKRGEMNSLCLCNTIEGADIRLIYIIGLRFTMFKFSINRKTSAQF